MIKMLEVKQFKVIYLTLNDIFNPSPLVPPFLGFPRLKLINSDPRKGQTLQLSKLELWNVTNLQDAFFIDNNL